MTISNSNNKKVYTGSGTSVFAYDFEIDASSEILVQQVTISDATTVTLTETTDYTVSGVGNASGGDVTLTAGSFPSGLSSLYKLVLTRNIPFTQTTDYVANDPFPAETHERVADRLTMMVQQMKADIDRAVLQPVDQTTTVTIPPASANMVIGWNAAATALENKSTDAAAAAAASATAAASSASSAATSETNASTSATAAATSATAAAASATAAANSAASIVLPTLTGSSDAKKKIIANSDGDGYELADGETLQDIDGDTKIQVEEGSDDDTIRFDTAGVQRVVIDSTGLSLASGIPVNSILDEDNMASDASNALVSQQSIKAYVDTQVASATGNIEDYSNGSTYNEAEADTLRTTSSTSYTKVKEFSPLQRDGNITTSFSLQITGNPAHVATGRIYINDVAVGTEHTQTGGSAGTKTDSNIAVSKGDVLSVYGKTSVGSSTCNVSLLKIQCLNPTLPVEVSGL